MRNLILGLALLVSAKGFGTAGMPKEIRFVFNPAEPETVITLEELDLSAFQVTKCLDMTSVITGKPATSVSTGMTYSGRAQVIQVGQQKYQLSVDSGMFGFNSIGCGLDLANVQSMALDFQNTRLPESRLELRLGITSKEYKDSAYLVGSGGSYRGKILSYY